jgi:hypothetical protein
MLAVVVADYISLVQEEAQAVMAEVATEETIPAVR